MFQNLMFFGVVGVHVEGIDVDIICTSNALEEAVNTDEVVKEYNLRKGRSRQSVI